jgi:hypothetical protein
MRFRFQDKDVWTKRERDGRISLWLLQDWLLDSIRGLREDKFRTRYRPEFLETVKGEKRKAQDILPDTGANWRFARKNGTYYYDFDRLPAGRVKHLPKKEELLELYQECLARNEQQTLESRLLAYCGDLGKWLKPYTRHGDIAAGKLARAAAVLEFAALELADLEPEAHNDYIRALAEVVKRNGWAYLPGTWRRLKVRISEAQEAGSSVEAVKLPREGNKNRQPYNDDQVIGWCLYMRARPENYSNAHIARRILKMCDIAMKPAPSFSWLEHYLGRQRVKFLTAAGRFGSSKSGQEYRDYLPIQGALYAGDCWQVDGTRINFLPHQSADGKERSLMIIAVRDVHSGDIIGQHFDTKEDRYGYIHAINMAVATTGHLPWELVYDRFPGHNTDEWEMIAARIKREGTKITITSTATGKSHVERCFSTIQDVFMQDFPYYYGQGVQSSREAAHRSPEYLASAKKQARREGWDFDAAWRSAQEVIERYRNTPLCEYSRKNAAVQECPRQLYDGSEKPNVYKADEFTRVEIFGTFRTETIRNNGLIRMQIHKAQYVYRIEDYEVIANYKQVNVYYDIEDLSKIYVFAPGDQVNSTFLCEAIEEQALAYYGPGADMAALAKAKAKRKAIRDQRAAELAEAIDGVADEVTLLLAAAAGKPDNDSAQSRWLEERALVWQDRGAERRVAVAEKPAPKKPLSDDDDFITSITRSNY